MALLQCMQPRNILRCFLYIYLFLFFYLFIFFIFLFIFFFFAMDLSTNIVLHFVGYSSHTEVEYIFIFNAV